MLELQELGLVELNAHEQVEIEGGILPLVIVAGFVCGLVVSWAVN